MIKRQVEITIETETTQFDIILYPSYWDNEEVNRALLLARLKKLSEPPLHSSRMWGGFPVKLAGKGEQA